MKIKETKDAGGHVEVVAKSEAVEKLLATIVEASPDEPSKIAEAILAEIASATSADELLSGGVEVLSLEDVVGQVFDVADVKFFPSRYLNGTGPNYFAAARCRSGDATFVVTTSSLKPLAKLAKAASEKWLPLESVTVVSSITAAGNKVYDLIKAKK